MTGRQATTAAGDVSQRYRGTIDVASIRIWLRDPVTPVAELPGGIR